VKYEITGTINIKEQDGFDVEEIEEQDWIDGYKEQKEQQAIAEYDIDRLPLNEDYPEDEDEEECFATQEEEEGDWEFLSRFGDKFTHDVEPDMDLVVRKRLFETNKYIYYLAETEDNVYIQRKRI